MNSLENYKSKVFRSHTDSEYLLAAPSCKPWDTEAKKQAIFFIFIMIIYSLSLHIGMVEVLKDPTVHDYFPTDLNENATNFLKALANLIIVLNFLYRFLHLGDNTATYFKRWSLMYFMKGFIQTITIIPAPDGVDQCRDRSLTEMMAMANCADMMFSGHTAITYLTCPQKYRLVIVPVVMTILVVTQLHYTADVIVAVIAA